MQQVLAQIAALVSSALGVYFFTAAVKKIKAIPINSGQTVRVRAFVGVLSALAAVGVSYIDGTMDATHLQELVTVVIQALSVAIGAHATHKVVKGE